MHKLLMGFSLLNSASVIQPLLLLRDICLRFAFYLSPSLSLSFFVLPFFSALLSPSLVQLQSILSAPTALVVSSLSHTLLGRSLLPHSYLHRLVYSPRPSLLSSLSTSHFRFPILSFFLSPSFSVSLSIRMKGQGRSR